MHIKAENKIAIFIPHSLLLLLLVGFLLNMPYTFFLLTPLYLALLSILDYIFKKDPSFSLDKIQTLPENEGMLELNWYSFASMSYLIFYLIILAIGTYYAQFEKPTVGWILYALPLGFAGASALNLCHEYMHTKYTSERIISRIVSSLCLWSVHEYEHLFVHHNANTICTDQDKTYATLNQSLYSFLIQAFVANYKGSWRIQKQICARNKTSFYNIFHNALLQTYLLSTVAWLLILFFVGTYAFIFITLQAMMSIFIFISTTYHQHYGLTRRKNNEGIYEPFTMMNIWNCDHYLISRLHFNVTHHSHHHLYQFCRYPYLKIIENSPILPVGYITALVISLFPPLWYRMMNKKVEQVFKMRDQAGNLDISQ